MTGVTAILEELGKAAKKGEAAGAKQAIAAARNAVKKASAGSAAALWAQLDSELATWETKLDVILREPAGRQGMVKHAQHWIERLKQANVA